eukprot:TRINITY_DN1539_c0_g1_i3.p1 TRINITY_DN1539_c0_g1~~TRINITY_DN1539_c0_g1_i3.p1  ORF type:complete len:598 (-),score=114.01 TRINITY_DN1539_c0_g1_i3:706-2499(-)
MASTEEASQQSYKIKRIDFLNRRNVPIVLQNENGPCPLLAVSNVLLLRNILNIHPDISEIPLQDLLGLVAHRLLDTNLSHEGKDDAYVQNVQQNVSDVIAMLPRLATGIDVNVRFRNVRDFEFTSETAIFDLLDISLVHGWLVDEQDAETAEAIGSKSYNTLVEELVALREKYPEVARLLEPSVSTQVSTESFESAIDEPLPDRTGEVDVPSTSASADPQTAEDEDDDDDDDEEDGPPSLAAAGRSRSMMYSDESVHAITRALQDDRSLGGGESRDLQREPWKDPAPRPPSPPRVEETPGSPSRDKEEIPSEVVEPPSAKIWVKNGKATVGWKSIAAADAGEPEAAPSAAISSGGGLFGSLRRRGDMFGDEEPEDEDLDEDVEEEEAALKPDDPEVQPSLKFWLDEGETVADRFTASKSGTGWGARAMMAALEEETTSVSSPGAPPTLEKAGRAVSWRRGEIESMIVVAPPEPQEKVEEPPMPPPPPRQAEEEEDVSLREAVRNGTLVYNFLQTTASQLTYKGLFSLQESIKERELCVFFRNNHFNTIFKFEGSLYMLATDQGYYNQPNLVWEKLNQLDGDTEFTAGSGRTESGARS